MQKLPEETSKDLFLWLLSDDSLPKDTKHTYLFEQMLETEKAISRKADVASVLARMSGNETAQRIVDIIIEGFRSEPRPPGAYKSIFNGIRALGPLKAVPAFLKALELTSDKSTTNGIVRSIIEIIFPEKDLGLRQIQYTTENSPLGEKRIYKQKTDVINMLEISNLSLYQQEVLQVLASLDNAWLSASDFLELYGLPSTREELKAFLTEA